ncbi:dadA1, partial [Symbiodinium sp. CCMP2456]
GAARALCQGEPAAYAPGKPRPGHPWCGCDGPEAHPSCREAVGERYLLLLPAGEARLGVPRCTQPTGASEPAQADERLGGLGMSGVQLDQR